MQETDELIWDDESASSGVHWAAIFAGAAGAAALSMILLVLGVGFGSSMVSPWPHMGASAHTVRFWGVVWLIFTQIVASGLGGYLAGRLRIKWSSVHDDEVYFRDTAHGFLAWAAASLLVVFLIGVVAGKAATGAASDGAAVAKTTGSQTALYMVDGLFRPAQLPSSATAATREERMEAEGIIANSLRTSGLPPQDEQYLAELVANRTGLSVADADKRVKDTFDRLETAVVNMDQSAKEAADHARKAAAHSALWMFVALLCGAFAASYCAIWGGRERDRMEERNSAQSI